MEINLKKLKPDIRYLNELKEVLYDKQWAKNAPDLKLYYMYRGIKYEEGLRYDITIIPSNILGNEFVKTKGHEHIGSFQEIYTVLEGKALFLMQKRNEKKIIDVYAVKAKKGESIIIPSYYGHITINPSKEKLILSNWISVNCQSEYNFFEKMQGACYYYIYQPKTKKAVWIKNKNYKKVPKLHWEKPLKSIPKNLDFLKG